MHPVIISVVYMRSTQPLYFDYYTIFTLFYGFSALSYMAATALFVSVEVPLAQVEKYFIRPLLGVAPTHQHHAPPPPHKAHASVLPMSFLSLNSGALTSSAKTGSASLEPSSRAGRTDNALDAPLLATA